MCFVFRPAYITHRQNKQQDIREMDNQINGQRINRQTDKTRQHKNGDKEFDRELRDL